MKNTPIIILVLVRNLTEKVLLNAQVSATLQSVYICLEVTVDDRFSNIKDGTYPQEPFPLIKVLDILMQAVSSSAEVPIERKRSQPARETF